ncbi:MAG: FAD-binding protein [Gammaproteobacteria bacterium]
MTTFSPRSPNEVTDALRWALAAGEAFDVVCNGSKRALGRPPQAPHTLDVSAIAGIVNYEPAELILTVRPGTPMEVVEAALAEKGQCLAFEPPDLSALLGATAVDRVAHSHSHRTATALAAAAAAAAAGAGAGASVGTLGGVIAAGLSGPRRVKAGAARDHVLGIAAVSGRGEAFVGGGKVVKNVTGYDMPKLMTASYGTLVVLTEVTVKVLPAAEDVRTLLVHGLGAQDAVRSMAGVLQSAVDASGACYLPAELVPPGISSGGSVTAFRIEGVRPSVEFRLTRLRGQLESAGSLTVLDRETSVEFWRGVRDVMPFARTSSAAGTSGRGLGGESDAGSGEFGRSTGFSESSRSGGSTGVPLSAARDNAAPIVWRLSVPPAEGANVIERIERSIPGAQAFLDWGGGLVWVQLPETVPGDAHARIVREAVGSTGGHATLIRAHDSVRASVEVFQPQPPALAALSKRVKAQFDPSRVLNPGRMYAEV